MVTLTEQKTPSNKQTNKNLKLDGDHHGSNALLNVSMQPVREGGSPED